MVVGKPCGKETPLPQMALTLNLATTLTPRKAFYFDVDSKPKLETHAAACLCRHVITMLPGPWDMNLYC